MSFTSRLALSFLVLFCTQSMIALGQSNSPWSSPGLARSFLSSFLADARRSGEFSRDQMKNMSSVRHTLMRAMEKMARSNESSMSQQQELNMAFASFLADIVVKDQGGSSIADKTKAIADAIDEAFVQTTGVVNVPFVNDITSLMTMLIS